MQREAALRQGEKRQKQHFLSAFGVDLETCSKKCIIFPEKAERQSREAARAAQGIMGGRAMKCCFCGHTESKVIDSRPTDEGASIRRRRECLACGKRFTTYETIETVSVMVVKKDKSREAFDR